MSEQTVAFLRHILPPTGLPIGFVGDTKVQRVFDTKEQLAQFLVCVDANRQNAYHACATYRDRKGVYNERKKKWEVRCHANVLLVSCLWADIDTREGKPDAPYADRMEAWQAVVGFCQVSGMPVPVFVSSGYGLHIYWVLCEPLPESEWRKYAKRLAALFAKHGLKVDKSRTQDSAYILRPPGTHNWKNGGCVLVECGELVGPYRIEDLPLGSTIEATPGVDRAIQAPSQRRARLSDDMIGAQEPPPWSEAEEARVRSALSCIPAEEYKTWIDIGMALHSTGWGERALKIYDDWSRTAPDKYSEDAQLEKWESFGRADRHGPVITLGTLFHMAKQHGWSDMDFKTDLGNARRLVARHGADIRFIPQWRSWIVWNGTRWIIDDDGGVMRFAKQTVHSMYHDALAVRDDSKKTALIKHALNSQSAKHLEAMVNLATTEAEVVLPARQLDADPWLLGVQNGVLELKTGTFRPAARDDYITKSIAVPYDPQALCPNWFKLLDTITAEDKPLSAYLQRAVGYALTGSTREEVLFVLYGIGNNGKSTWRETLHALFGDYAIASDAGLLIERKTPGGATPELARLKGRRFVAINETSENDHLNEARVKFITSHDMITARDLYQKLFDFVPTHKTFLTTNHKPIIRGTDVGIWRRIHLLPFTVTISPEKVEKDFRERRLVPELPGILNWAMEGLRAYLKEGLNPPRAVYAATHEYQQDMDVVGQWIDERCGLDPQASIPTAMHTSTTSSGLGMKSVGSYRASNFAAT
jgi:putative DNA primase/helicase